MFENYLKIAIRSLFKNKTYTAINIIGLALGIACGLGIFMIVNFESGFDKFHRESNRIYRVVSDFHYPGNDEYSSGVPFPLPAALKLDVPKIKYIATIFGATNSQIDIAAQNSGANEKRFIEKSGVYYANQDFFRVFNFKWLAGDAAILSKPNHVALSRHMAETYFGSWQNALGKTIKKDKTELLQITGILEDAPQNTDFQYDAVISYVTLTNGSYAKPLLSDWGTVSSAEQCYISLEGDNDAPVISRQLLSLRKKYLGSDNKTDFFNIQPLSDVHYSQKYGNFNYSISRSTLWSLSLVGLFLLSLAGINFINLATAQAVKRSREVGIRKVLGSKRWQLGLQFIGETFVVVFMATVLAIGIMSLLAPYAQKILDHSVSMNPFNSAETIGFIFLILIAVTLLSGFYPAVIVSGYKPIQAIKNKITSVSSGGISLRRVLVVFQFFIAQGLIIATLVVISQIRFFEKASLGFNKAAIVTVAVPRDSVSRLNWQSFIEQIKQFPGVKQVSLSNSTPASQGAHTTSFRFNQNSKDDPFELNVKPGDADYFKTYQLSLAAGKFYEPSDTARELIVNETFVKKEGLRSNEEAIGKYIMLGGKKLLIAGVVKDFHQTSLRSPIVPIAILPQKVNYRMVGIKVDPQSITATLKNLNALYTRTFPENVFEYNFLDDTVEKFYSQEQHLAQLFQLFAGVGIFISCIGLYGLVLFMTLQRIKEVGLRKILGASVLNIMTLFFGEFISLIGIAFVIAAAVSWYVMNAWLANFAYHTAISWWVFAVVGLISVVLAVITVSSQTIKAALSNPVKSLRTE